MLCGASDKTEMSIANPKAIFYSQVFQNSTTSKIIVFTAHKLIVGFLFSPRFYYDVANCCNLGCYTKVQKQ